MKKLRKLCFNAVKVVLAGILIIGNFIMNVIGILLCAITSN